MFHPTVLPWWWFKVVRKDENQTDGRRDERRRLKLGRQFPLLPLFPPTEFQPPPFIPSSVGLIFVLPANFEPPPRENGWVEHVGSWSEVVSGDEVSVYQI